MIGSLAITLALTTAATAPTPVPIAMQGTWGKHGRCDVLADRLTITRHTAGWGKGPFDRIYYDPQSEVPTIYWDEEGVVDNFVMGRTRNLLVHNTLGSHMPGEEGYARCGPGHKRVAWPPR